MKIECFVQQKRVWDHTIVINISVYVVDIFNNDFPPLSGFLRRYIGYRPTFKIVSLVKIFGKILVHFSSAMQADDRFRLPHGP